MAEVADGGSEEEKGGGCEACERVETAGEAVMASTCRGRPRRSRARCRALALEQMPEERDARIEAAVRASAAAMATVIDTDALKRLSVMRSSLTAPSEANAARMAAWALAS